MIGQQLSKPSNNSCVLFYNRLRNTIMKRLDYYEYNNASIHTRIYSF